MTNPQPEAGNDCVLNTVLGFILPFYIAGAGGDVDTARIAIQQLIEEYKADTMADLDLIGRMLTYSAAAMDSLRLSMRPDLSDTKILRYRANAIALGRSADDCRKTLQASQAKRGDSRQPAAGLPPSPTVQPEQTPLAPPAGVAAPDRIVTPDRTAPPEQLAAPHDTDPEFDFNVREMQRNIHAMLAGLQNLPQGVEPEAAHKLPNPAGLLPTRAMDGSEGSHRNALLDR